jgi:hypothetical protein
MHGRHITNPLILGLIQSEQIALPQFVTGLISFLHTQISAQASKVSISATQLEAVVLENDHLTYAHLHATSMQRRYADELEANTKMLASYHGRYSRLQLFTAAHGTNYLFLDEIAMIRSLSGYFESFEDIEVKLNKLIAKHAIVDGKIVDNFKGREGRTYVVFPDKQKMKNATETLTTHFESLDEKALFRIASLPNTIEILSLPLIALVNPKPTAPVPSL